MDAIGVRFTGAPQTVKASGIELNLPPDSSIPHKWKDTFGARLGGDYNVIQDLLAVRAGAWFQSSAIDPKYVYVDFFPTQRVGLTGGATVRVKPVDIQVGYQHIFMASVDNKGDGQVKALTGTGTGQSAFGINGGKLTGSANVFSIGAVARF
jgi:long-chain fatty acid transport protein